MKILVVDDDPQLRELLTITLTRADYTVVTAADGQTALTHAKRETPALIVLDIGLPELDGLEVCRRIRATSDVPILFLTARDDEVDRIVGLELGADDYVTKPFSPRELVARVRAILKRTSQGSAVQSFTHQSLTLTPSAHTCTLGPTKIPLTGTEMKILATLMRTPEVAQSKRDIITAIWGRTSQVSDRTLDSHLRNIRAKLADAGAPEAIETIHAVGMRMGACR